MQEAITYGMKTAGHDVPQPERRYEQSQNPVNPRWRKAFEAFLNSDERYSWNYYPKAIKLVRDLPLISAVEAHRLLLEYREHPNIRFAGVFLSVVYNIRCSDDTIVFDIPLPKTLVYGLGLNFSKGKSFVNQTSSLSDICFQARGIVINYDKVYRCCSKAAGKFVNYGDCSTDPQAAFGGWAEYRPTRSSVFINMGTSSQFAGLTEGIAFNFNDVGLFGWRCTSRSILINAGKATTIAFNGKGRVIALQDPKEYKACDYFGERWLSAKQCQNMPRLSEYVENIRQRLEPGRKYPVTAIEIMKSLRRENIEKDLECIITAGGYKW